MVVQLEPKPRLAAPTAATSLEALVHLRHSIEHAAHLLPAQGPISVFIHHNTLHALEDLPFTDAVKEGSRIFGCQPYLTEDNFREALARGRIRFSEIRDVLMEEVASLTPLLPKREEVSLGTRLDLRLAMLQYPLRQGSPEELRWFVEETDALKRVRPEASSVVRSRLIAETRRWVMRDFRSSQRRQTPRWLPALFESSMETWDDDAWEALTLQSLWYICLDGVRHAPASAPRPNPVRHRDLLLEAGAADIDIGVNDLLIRLCGAFLDQGVADWPMPERDKGFYRAFIALYRQAGGPPERWMQGLLTELQRLAGAEISALECVRESLDQLGVPEAEWDEYIAATLLALRGWGGMLMQVEIRGDRVAHPVPVGSLVEFLAVRLLLERFAIAFAARQDLGYEGSLADLRGELATHRQGQNVPNQEQRAFAVFQLAQLLGWLPEELYRLSAAEWATLVAEIEAFPDIERRRVFHLAFERRFRTQTLDTLALHRRRTPQRGRPRFQVVCCLDEREESFRRHLEEIAPDVDTQSAAGFYNMAMYYRGAADAHFVPLCPVIVFPKHWVAEQVDDAHADDHRRRAKTRQAIGAASHGVQLGSRSMTLGALLTAGFGVLASVPLVARILFPRFTAKVTTNLHQFVQTPAKTRLKLERAEATPGMDNGQLGFSLDEMSANAERLLRDIGMTSAFARLVFLLGHGSGSLNNPHKSAYDCGACGGNNGGPNARAMAHILNDPRVRARMKQNGVVIPDDTIFIGGMHNTCNDSVTLFDADRVPAPHQEEFNRAIREIDEACARNAHERSRRFLSAPLTQTFAEAHRHVEARAEDLAQTRPELGHATNAICIVGRRERTRGLFLDRRAFLTSYDPVQDDAEHSTLMRILGAAIPVCAGINLEYYFSRVDSPGWGCGSKLPHNITSLLGVMDGAASDLRTGLPWQMVEIHEPVRLLFIIETTPEAMLDLMERNAMIGKLCKNGWIQLAVQDPDSAELQVYQNGEFRVYEPQSSHLPTAESSANWYRGCRDHLEFAEIVSA